MKILMIVFFVAVVIIELFILTGCFTTVKYKIEIATNISHTLISIYSMLNTLSSMIIFDLIYLLIMHILFFKN